MSNSSDFEQHYERDINPNRGHLGSETGSDGEGVDEMLSELITEMRREFVGLPEEICIEIVEFLKDRGEMQNSRSSRIQLPQWIAKFHKILRYAKAHPNVNAIYACLHIWDEPMLDDINGNLSPTEFASEMGMTKAAVNNAIKDAQKFFHQSPRKDQRSLKSCAAMSAARIGKLKPVK